MEPKNSLKDKEASAANEAKLEELCQIITELYDHLGMPVAGSQIVAGPMMGGMMPVVPPPSAAAMGSLVLPYPGGIGGVPLYGSAFPYVRVFAG